MRSACVLAFLYTAFRRMRQDRRHSLELHTLLSLELHTLELHTLLSLELHKLVHKLVHKSELQPWSTMG
jgi:hypothetical protein